VSTFPDLKIVVVNWNLKEDTLECLDSILRGGVSAEQIILVDNGSTDGSIPAIYEQCREKITVICNPLNIGYAPATNQGIKCAIEQDAKWIMLLNNDTVVDIHLFEEIYKIIQLNPDYSILAPMILYYDPPEKIWYLGDHLIPGTLLTYNAYRGKSLKGDVQNIISVDFVSGCAMCVHKSVFERIGYLNETLVMYGEEIDLIWRARLSGYKLAAIPKAKMWHKVSTSAKRVAPQTRYLQIRNQVIFYRRYANRWQIPLMFTFTIARAIFLLVKDILTGNVALIPPMTSGLIEGWFGKIP
jgi:GT2 family glycosyltransferase